MGRWNGLNNHGVALVTVLLITVLITTILAFLMQRQQVDIRRTGHLLDAEQEEMLSLGMTDWASRILRQDLKKGEVDHLGEDWALRLPGVPVEGGMLNGYMDDMQGRFNLNNVMAADPNLRAFSRLQFERLLEGCGQSRDLVNGLIDWLDENSEISGAGGAEDETYLYLQPGYQTANQKMVSITELRLITGMDVAWSCLEPLVTALPEDSMVNVNTAGPEVLASLSDNWSLTDAKKFVEERPASGFESVAKFLESESLAGSGLTPDYLSVASSYFLAYTDARIGVGRMEMYTLLHRQPNGVHVVWRAIGSY